LIANICYLADVILAKSLVHVRPSLLKELAGNPRDNEEISRLSLKMMVYVRKFKTLGPSVFKKLQGNMLSSHMGIVHVMRFDEGFACPPNGRLIVDCVDS
jgi:hypothetical protein